VAEDARMIIARRAAQAIQEGEVVNLGVGIPQLVADVIGSKAVHFQSENGILDFGPPPTAGQEDEDLVDAGKRFITTVPGTAFFHSADSFAMIRGGHVDAAVMGTLQVDQEGSIANWLVPGAAQLGVGGAMDLLAGAKRVIIATTITTSDGKPKILKRCTLPLSARHRVNLIVTEEAVFEVQERRLVLTEVAPGLTPDDIRAKVEADFEVSKSLKPMQVN
jgi:acetate CoA/acetoacetate CoA-transferase beta subunit